MIPISNREHPSAAPPEEDISLIEMANTLLRNWRVLGILPIMLALTVGVWTFSKERAYTSLVTFAPQIASSRGGAGGATALAQQFGLNLGGDQGERSPQFYADLLHRMAILKPAVEAEYQIPWEGGGIERGTLITLLEVQGRSHLPAWRVAADRLRENIAVSYNWETGVVRFTVTAHHPALAEQIAERLLDLLNQFNTELRQRRAQEEGRFISERVADAQAELISAEATLQEFLRQNREFRNSPELMFDYDRLQRQVAMHQEVYTTLLRSREQARIDGVRDTPLLAVIDHPAGSAVPRSKGTILRAVLAFLLGLVIATIIAFVREYSRRGRERGDPQFQEFEGLVYQTWNEVRRPTRWLGRRETPAAGDH